MAALVDTKLLSQFVVIYPTEAVVRTALRGAAAYQLAFYDAHLWVYAECYGLASSTIGSTALSECRIRSWRADDRRTGLRH